MQKKAWLSANLVAVASLSVLALASTTVAEDRSLEQLDPETAYSEISSSAGVILVDLYADW
jgi:hypothetical protein